MLKKKNKIALFLLPLLSITVVALYGYYSFISAKKNIPFQATKEARSNTESGFLGTNIANIQKIENGIKNNNQYLLSYITNTGIIKNDDIFKTFGITLDGDTINASIEDLKTKVTEANTNSDKIIASITDAIKEKNHSKILYSIAEYISLLELVKCINLGLNYESQLRNLEIFATNNPSLLNLVHTIKESSALNNLQLVKEYQKIAPIIKYEIFFKNHEKSTINNLLFKIQNYVGFTKEADINFKNATLLLNKKYQTVLDFIISNNFTNPDINKFQNQLKDTIKVDEVIFDCQKNLVKKISDLVNTQ